MAIRRAIRVLRAGGVVSYPTEGVFGLGCCADDPAALARLLRLKHRDPDKGLILIAAQSAHLHGWMKLPDGKSLPPPLAGRPITWIVPAAPDVSRLIRGSHADLAIRLTNNPIAYALCDALQAPLVSTSANRSGRPVVRNRFTLRREFGHLVDYVVPGDCGPASGPSEIRHFQSGLVLRPTAT